MSSPGDYLTSLGNTLNNQFNSNSGNKNIATDIAQNGTSQNRGTLGGFANNTDQFVDRSYTEEGSFRVDFYNPKPKQLDILMQDPDVTVLVKKRAFASLAENFRPDLMDEHETLFFRTTKILFQNKCKQLSAYEKLSKIAVVTGEIGAVDYNLLPIIFSATDTLMQVPGTLGLNGIQSSINGSLTQFASIVNRVREIIALSQDNYYSKWITAIPDSFRTDFGEGTGVIEFTNVTSLSTTTTLQFAGGRFDLSFADPYEIMLITNLDIEQAISDATNMPYNNSFFQLGITSLDQTISQQKSALTLARISRGAAPISFIVQPSTYSGQVVIAVIESLGFQINFNASNISNITNSSNIDPSALLGSAAAGNNGLAPNEVSLFNNIVSMLMTQLSTSANVRQQAVANNQDPKKQLNALRKKMRLHYASKLLIQPMDNVHIYIGSKKKIDKKIIGGLQSSFAAQGFLQGINNLTQNIKDTFAVNENYALEKSIFVGDQFPNWLWQILRNNFISNKNGAHVFAGIVENASSSYSNGAFHVSASGSDNAGYFKYGVVNFKPSVDVFNGALYDPMTPFKLEFDSLTGAVKYPSTSPGNQPEAPELLDENKGIFSSAFVKNKNGLLTGLVPTEASFTNQDADRLKNNSTRRVFYDPDGMVYRWKEGIATLVLFGDSYEPNPSVAAPPSILEEPFAGQDIINACSLLITGEPYNFATFYKAATQTDSFKRDAASNQGPSGSYFRGLQTSLKAKNAIYGNFIPFKQLTMDEATFQKVQTNQLNAIKYDAELAGYLQQRASLADSLAVFGKTTSNSLANSPNAADNQLAIQMKQLDQQISDRVNSIADELGSDITPLGLIGNDPSYDYDPTVNTSGNKTRLDNSSRKDLRRKLNFLTRRLAWKVRNNEDVNYLIVDDTYDKDIDIQAFVKTPVNPQQFKSEYMTVADKINNIKDVMGGMEIFANTQGHIEVRNPKYNRMPSSAFFNMLRMKTELGVQVYPQFLEDLYSNQVGQLYTNVEVLEDEIRLYCLALGKNTDTDCDTFIGSLGGAANGFSFISNETTGTITGGALNIQTQANPDSALASPPAALTSQISVGTFSAAATVDLILGQAPISGTTNNPTQFQNLSRIQATANTITRQQLIINRLQGKTGQTFDFSQIANPSGSTLQTALLSSVNLLQITNGISQRLSQRQSALKQLSGAIKNANEALNMFNGSAGPGDTPQSNSSLSPALYNSRNIPQVFESMIEDESYDDLGEGSAKRYVLKNHDIISYNISENRPDYTSIEVTGLLSGQYTSNNELPPDLNVFQSGNAMTTAAAVDYDLWRMYGMSLPQGVNAPWLSNPDTQCAPYAVSLLNRARHNILRGTIEVIGNEYQQPGEVVYVENRDLLFYVESVSHQFNFGRSFTTSMQLTYGHNAGEYIPTFLDVVGKSLYKNQGTSNLVHKKQGNTWNQEYLGTIVGDTSPTAAVGNTSSTSSLTPSSSGGSSTSNPSTATTSTSSSAASDITMGPYGDTNRLALQNIIDLAGQSLSNSSGALQPVLEIRVYFNSAVSSFASANSYATQLQSAVLSYLTGASTLADNAQPLGSTTTSQASLAAFKANIKTVAVDSNPTQTGEFRYPSAKAFYYARKAVDKTSSGLSGSMLQQQIDNVIYSYMTDCWIVFQNPTTTTTNSTTNTTSAASMPSGSTPTQSPTGGITDAEVLQIIP